MHTAIGHKEGDAKRQVHSTKCLSLHIYILLYAHHYIFKYEINIYLYTDIRDFITAT